MTDQAGATPPSTLTPHLLASVLAIVAARGGVDLRDYRAATAQRGIEARIRATGCPDAASYLSLLEQRPEEIRPLLEAILVRVTQFFRDPGVWAALQYRVLPSLAAQNTAGSLLRAWSIGTASGEEAWSVAFLLGALGNPFEVLATDISQRALTIARAGVYPTAATLAVPSDLRERYLETIDQHSQVRPALRGHVLFAEHDLMSAQAVPREAVLAAFDLILLRNVLIYLDPRLQRKAFERATQGLVPGGALVLGSAEVIPPEAESLLEPFPRVAPELRIYRRRERS